MTPLKAERMAMGLTANKAAELSRVTTENRLYLMERGRMRPKPLEADGLAAMYHTTIEELFPNGVQKEV